MAANPTVRFSFDFAELFEAAPEPLHVLETNGQPPPPEAVRIAPGPRPRWLGRLLPVLRRGDSLRLEIVAGAAPGFADHLGSALAATFAAAGSGSGVCVLLWPGGLAVGWDGLGQLPATPTQSIVACDLSVSSAALALAARASRPGAWLAVNGALPVLLERLSLGGDRVVSLPLLGATELAGQEDGASASVRGRRYGAACAALAAGVLQGHLLRES